MTESQLQDAIRLALGSDPELCLWRNNVGQSTDQHTRRTIRFGVGNPGGSDLIGVFRGRFLAVEIKTPTGRQRDDQKLFQQLVERKGGTYVILRSVDEARAWLEHLRETVPA
jgi:hypothetical protein